MAVESMSVDGEYRYKLNEYNGRQIMWKPNRHGARWRTFPEVYGSEGEAREAMAKLVAFAPKGEGAVDEGSQAAE
jgi:hypothetical protein